MMVVRECMGQYWTVLREHSGSGAGGFVSTLVHYQEKNHEGALGPTLEQRQDAKGKVR